VSLPASFPRSTLCALIDRIIPEDEFPGAILAGVETYLVRQLQGDCAAETDALIHGLFSLEAEAKQQTGLSFTDLSTERQDALLHAIEAGQVATPWPPSLPATVTSRGGVFRPPGQPRSRRFLCGSR
jgi:hypothetical protein